MLTPEMHSFGTFGPADSSNLGSLVFTLEANTGFSQTATVSAEEDAFKPDGDTLMHIVAGRSMRACGAREVASGHVTSADRLDVDVLAGELISECHGSDLCVEVQTQPSRTRLKIVISGGTGYSEPPRVVYSLVWPSVPPSSPVDPDGDD